MSHLAVPAASLVATHCALCGRALVDAESVECGVGPVCRGKYGYADGPEGNREAANALVYQIAAEPHGTDVATKIRALRDLGYTRLADRLAERLIERRGTLVIHCHEGMLVIQCEGLDREAFGVLLQVLRTIPGRRYMTDQRVNLVPVAQKRALWEGLKAQMPAGVVIRSERGERVL